MLNKKNQANKNRITILSVAEKFALYGVPDFNKEQQTEYFAFSKQEQRLIFKRKGINSQIYCATQLGYFKAKQLFFTLTWLNIQKEDLKFIINNYFDGRKFIQHKISKHENYAQRLAITQLLGYKLWSKGFIPTVKQQIAQIIKRGISPNFIVTELVMFLNQRKIIRPTPRVFQDIISEALSNERNRISKIIINLLNSQEIIMLKQLLRKEHNLAINGNLLSGLAALKQDPKDFNFKMMGIECQKQKFLEPLYKIANNILPALNISKQNIDYYATLANYYTIYELKRIKFAQTALYLLCYIWKRYQQLNDNLIDAFSHHVRKLENDTKEHTKEKFIKTTLKQNYELQKIGSLLSLYIDQTIANVSMFGEIRNRAFKIMPEKSIQSTVEQMSTKPVTAMDLFWQTIDQNSFRYKKHLRPLLMSLNFVSPDPNNAWLLAINQLKSAFVNKQKVTVVPIDEDLKNMIPKKLHSYLFSDVKGSTSELYANRYEVWMYRQLRKRFNSGELYLQDSIKNRYFDDELVPTEQKEEILKKLNIPWSQKPVEQQLNELTLELKELWLEFNKDLSAGKLGHLEYDANSKTISCHKIKVNKDEKITHNLYGKLPLCDIVDVLRFVNQKCNFLSAFIPLQPRYTKKEINDDSLIAIIVSQAMNHGNSKMPEICNISSDSLDITNQQCFRLATLKAANDLISNDLKKLSIFPHYSIDLVLLYGGVDGQKFDVRRPTTKARPSKKYFKNGKGVVAYTLLANHVPLDTRAIGPHEHESHYMFDIWYGNTCNIVPDVITGDMHVINKINFMITYCFGIKLNPRFTNLQLQLKHIYCADHLDNYKNCLMQPTEVINCQLIIEEKSNIDRIVASLGLKEITQSTLVKKLCSHTQNKTRRAIFELDKLIRSIYTLKYLRDPELQRKINKSQNRVESYHQLRAAIAQVGGRKELSGKNDINIEISNQCGRLVANAIIYYNSVILSKLLAKYEATGNKKLLRLIKKISPVAWQHIHFLGHYNFNLKNVIDLEKILANFNFEATG